MIHLREINKGDLTAINRWRNDKEVIDTLGSVFRFINEETEQKWFEGYMSARGTNVRLAICTQAEDACIGMVNLTNIDWQNRHAEFSIMIGDKNYHAKGYGTEATGLMLKHAFDNLNLHRVYLYVLPHNEKAIAVYKKAGFHEEGRLKQCVFKNGQYHDMLVMAVMAKNS